MDSQGEHKAGPGVSRSRRRKELGIKSKNGGAGTTGAPPVTPFSSPSGRQDIGVQTLRVGMCGGGPGREHQDRQPEQPTH